MVLKSDPIFCSSLLLFTNSGFASCRFRIPWKGGARRVPLDVALPWLLVPLNLWLSSLSLTWLLVVHGAIMPLMVYLTYRLCLRSHLRPQTKFFASWSAATTFCLFLIYQYQVTLKFQQIRNCTHYRTKNCCFIINQ